MRTVFSTILVLFFPYGAQANSTTAATHPVVIELFTSQGCSSCPAADKLVGSYADSQNVLPLSFHISYWNYIGWDDPYSKEGFTKRQHEYKSHLGRFNVYTPQAVVQGRHDIVGSNARLLQNGIREAAVSTPWVDITLQLNGETLDASIPSATVPEAKLLLVGFQKQVKTSVSKGENAGRLLSHRNSVLELLHIGTYSGKALNITYKKPAGDGLAVLLQAVDDGRIIGAAWL